MVRSHSNIIHTLTAGSSTSWNSFGVSEESTTQGPPQFQTSSSAARPQCGLAQAKRIRKDVLSESRDATDASPFSSYCKSPSIMRTPTPNKPARGESTPMARAAPDSTPSIIPLQIGAPVRVVGLQGTPELNGTDGICETWDGERGRWYVRLDGGGVKSLKSENLVPAVKSPHKTQTVGADSIHVSPRSCVATSREQPQKCPAIVSRRTSGHHDVASVGLQEEPVTKNAPSASARIEPSEEDPLVEQQNCRESSEPSDETATTEAPAPAGGVAEVARLEPSEMVAPACTKGGHAVARKADNNKDEDKIVDPIIRQTQTTEQFDVGCVEVTHQKFPTVMKRAFSEDEAKATNHVAPSAKRKRLTTKSSVSQYSVSGNGCDKSGVDVGTQKTASKVLLAASQPRASLSSPEAEDAKGDGPLRLQAPVVAAALGGDLCASQSVTSTSKACDKCDGPHLTDACPYFQKPREKHKDAWAGYGAKTKLAMGTKGVKFVLKGARLVRQPGDGSCLFHSICCGLNGVKGRGGTASKVRTSVALALRRETARFVKEHPQLKIAGDTIEEWVRWDARVSYSTYARRMAVGGWGGGIEMAVCARLKKVNVHVYELGKLGQFQRISCFNFPRDSKSKQTVHVLYQGRMHYDALVVDR